MLASYPKVVSREKLIEKILPRKNEFERPKVSNIDQAFIITSLVNPDFSLNLLDKLLVLMELHNVEAIICITKEDLVDSDKLKEVDEILKYYEEIGYKVVSNRDVSKIKALIKDKTSVFTGQTGAGKSTLLKILCKYYKIKDNCITYGNYDLNKIPISNIRKEITYISQNEIIYTDTIKNKSHNLQLTF